VVKKMNLEARYQATSYIFTYELIESNLPVNITTAVITIKDDSGNIVNSYEDQGMTINGNVATFDADLSSMDISMNNIAEMVINGTYHTRLYDIVRYPFYNEVIDDDLFNENDRLRREQSEVTGEADSGTTTTLIDSERDEIDGFFNGGRIKIWEDANIESSYHTISSWTSNTITFTPARDTAVADGTYYSLRRSYQSQIDRAGEKVQIELKKNDMRAYMVLDQYQLNDIIVYRFFVDYYQQLRKEEDDEFDLQYKYYLEEYKSAIAGIPLIYDKDQDGVPDEETTTGAGNIKLLRK
jgi:hypothetical protein